MTLAWLGCLAYAPRPWLRARPGFALDVALVAWVACLGLVSTGFQWAPAWQGWSVALPAGVVLFGGSVLATTPDWRRYFLRRVRVARPRCAAFARVALLAPVYEEVVWRMGWQSLLTLTMGAGMAVVLAGAGFAAWHRRAFTNGRLALEFLAFSWVLGACYAVYHDLVVVILIHALRNVFAFSVLESDA